MTHIRDEEVYLHAQQDIIHTTNPHLAHQIGVYRLRRGRFNSLHICRIRQIANLSGFTGSASVGVALETVDGAAAEHIVGPEDGAAAEHIVGPEDGDIPGSQEQLDLQEEQEAEEEQEQLDNDLLDILTISMDRMQVEH